MWGSRRDRGDDTVTCIACGENVVRSDAREYDKFGNRWERADKEFEYLCKPCDRRCCHQPRQGLEDLLEEAGAGTLSQKEFLVQFRDATENRTEQSE